MKIVTQLKPQKNQKRVNVFLDGSYAFPLDLDTLVKSNLKVGQKLSEKEIEDLVFKNQTQKFLDGAYRLLSFRPRSEKEIENYLRKKKAIPKVSEWVIEKLKEKKLIDDEAFVVWWLDQRSTFRPRGKIALKMELRKKGIDIRLAEKVINESVDELVLAKKAAAKKMRIYQKLEPLEFKRKMTGFLSRQGFSWGTIKETLEEVGKIR